ncbi:MAG: nitrophenyl compound nitroreductase subunit ArsF family protein [Thermoguttaceae bacterium]
MELKNAVAVCLISLFSATIVVLIARSLDSQAASQLQPQLTSIAEELRALRKQGGSTVAADASATSDNVNDGLIVYYFHSSARCPTCRSIEAQADEAVKTFFASQLDKGEVIWKIANYEQAAAKPLAEKFKITMPVVVLVRMKDGQIEKWNRLDRVWALVGDKPAFAKYMRQQIEQMLPPVKKTDATKPAGPPPVIPVPSADDAPAKDAPAIPIP